MNRPATFSRRPGVLLGLLVALLVGLAACGDDDEEAEPPETELCAAAAELQAELDEITVPADMLPAARRVVDELDGDARQAGEIWYDALVELGEPADMGQGPILPNVDELNEAAGTVTNAVEDACPGVGVGIGRFLGPATP